MNPVSQPDRPGDDARGGPLGHLTPEQLDELSAQASADRDPDQAVAPDPDSEALQAHLDGCAACRTALGDQVAVSALLHRVPDPGPMPSDYATRLDAAIAAAQTARAEEAGQTAGSRGSAPAGEPGGARPADVVPLDPGGRSSRWAALAESRLTKSLVAAAAVVLIGAGGYAALHRSTSDQQSSASAGSAASVPAPVAGGVPTRGAVKSLAAVPVVSSGTAYSKANIATEVTGRLATATAAAAQGDAQPNKPAAEAAGSTLGTVAGIKACLQAIDAPTAVPELIDLATFEGKPAAILVLPDTNGTKEVWVVSRTCSGTNDGTLFFEPLP
jgi:hypothetical protein